MEQEQQETKDEQPSEKERFKDMDDLADYLASLKNPKNY